MLRRILPFIFIPLAVHASEPSKNPETLLGPAPPYVPRPIDYSMDVGLLNSRDRDELFWGSVAVGAHVGRCIFSQSETCQQYVDGIAGLGIREGESQAMFTPSLRWQYVNFPDRWSPFWRVLGGAALIQGPAFGRGWRTMGGAGAGVTTYLHERVDLRFEVRGIATDRTFAQVMVGAHIKIDNILQAFANKLHAFGKGTVNTAIEATGTALKATGEGLSGIASSFRESSSPTPTPTPSPTPTPAP